MSQKRIVPVLVFVSVLLVGAAVASAADPVCVQARQWIQANGDHLPKTYDEFVKLPVAYQPAVFDVLSADTKSELWRAHLTQYLEQHPSLDRTKTELVNQAIEFVSRPTTFSTPHTDPLWGMLVGQTTKKLEKKFQAAFGKDEADAIVGRFTPENHSALRVMELDATGAKAILQCSCSTQSDWCSPSPYRCYVNNPTCATTSGCGTFFQYTCNGTCQNRS
jgi:hypothetical protein